MRRRGDICLNRRRGDAGRMNKAFVREPDRVADFCPRCGAQGQPVTAVTLEAHVLAQARESLAECASFCPTPHCAVVYFDTFERFVELDGLKHPLYPKDPEAPICPCFNFTRDEIEQDIREGVVTRTKALLARAQSPEANCEVHSATGQPCVAQVQRYYMQHRGQSD